ncbi:hypothetical protein [Nitrosopumilus adriaticus]|uniref:Uncharacterized protein n=1 Tax=Nitrosopumilus adriaticus TaxID=1580092 RepID=A0A0D5C1V3_9ARCH|nr:hypothetical protein [Nitrosopumilus adriaticus]AJW70290.1 exported protein of unknown function [Nitrosopumilus adriaticus]
MKTRLLIIIAFVMVSTITESFAEEIEIKFDETLLYDSLKLYFYDIEDSRCPLDVTCVWEGKVSAMIHVSNETHKIGGGFEIGKPLTYITPYTITLIDVKPHPISTENPDYVAILEITKSDSTDELTDEQVCGVGNVLLDGVCVPENKIEEHEIDQLRGESLSNPEVMIIIESLGAGLIVLFIVIYAIKKKKKK